MGVAISPSGEWAASCDREGSTRLWHLQSGEDEPLADSDWPEKITAVAFSTDSTLMAAGSSKGRVAIWSVKKGTAIQRVRLNSPAITSLQFGPKGESLIAACKPEQTSTAVLPTVWRIDLKTGQYHEFLRASESPRSFPYLATLDHGGKRLITIGKAIGDAEFFKGLSVIEIWSLATGQRLHASADFKGDVERIAIAPNNGRLVASLTKRQLQVFALPDRDTSVAVNAMNLRPDDRFRRKHG
jgi:WD40 repeat protein